MIPHFKVYPEPYPENTRLILRVADSKNRGCDLMLKLHPSSCSLQPAADLARPRAFAQHAAVVNAARRFARQEVEAAAPQRLLCDGHHLP